MAINTIVQSGVQGLRDSLALAQDAASRIAQSTTPTEASLEDITEAVVDLAAAELQAKAATKVIETGARTIGTLIDVLA